MRTSGIVQVPVGLACSVPKARMLPELEAVSHPQLPMNMSRYHFRSPVDDQAFVSMQVPVGLACSAPEARVLPELEALGLTDRLAAVVTAEDVARGRPDPDAVLLAAQRLGRPAIRCVLIGGWR